MWGDVLLARWYYFIDVWSSYKHVGWKFQKLSIIMNNGDQLEVDITAVFNESLSQGLSV